MASDSACASASVTCPAAYAFQSRPDTAGNSARGDASTARRSSSTNMTSPPGQKTRQRGAVTGSPDHRPSIPVAESEHFQLDERPDFREDHVAIQTFRAPAGM